MVYGVVVSDVGGTWHLVPFFDTAADPGGSSPMVGDPTTSGTSIIETGLHTELCPPAQWPRRPL